MHACVKHRSIFSYIFPLLFHFFSTLTTRIFDSLIVTRYLEQFSMLLLLALVTAFRCPFMGKKKKNTSHPKILSGTPLYQVKPRSRVPQSSGRLYYTRDSYLAFVSNGRRWQLNHRFGAWSWRIVFHCSSAAPCTNTRTIYYCVTLLYDTSCLYFQYACILQPLLFMLLSLLSLLFSFFFKLPPLLLLAFSQLRRVPYANPLNATRFFMFVSSANLGIFFLTTIQWNSTSQYVSKILSIV